MVKCSNPGCECTEFRVEGIKAVNHPTTLHVLVCNECNRIITVTTKSVEALFRTLKH
jgi:Fe2+ or Zn2+ uptake regulation protein